LAKKTYRKTVLDNGLVVATESMEGIRSISLGYFTRQGTRDEDPEVAGVSHFLEHMLFKGTRNRDARQIASELEDRGGSLDAATAKEFISVYARFLFEDLELAVDLIGDLVSNPTFPEEELQKEKGVILEEYREFVDSPEEYVFFLLFRALFEGHPLSREVLGKPETIKAITRNDIVARWKEAIAPENSFIAAAGFIDHEELVAMINEKFSFPKNEGTRWSNGEFPKPGFFKESRPALNQVHFSLGVRIPPYSDKRRYPFIILNSILGYGMSSRLFFELREKRGLVYSVTSFLEFYRDAGVFGVYFSLEPGNLDKAYKVLLDELEKVRKNGIREDELKRAKGRVRGSLALSQESSSSRMSRVANYELHKLNFLHIDEVLERFEEITLDEVMEVASEFLVPDNYGIGLVGPESIMNWNP